jgi:ketosteroid isomerase-like protein
MTSLAAKAVATGFFADVSAGRAAEAWSRLSPELVYDIIGPPPVGGRVDRDGLGRAYGLVMSYLATPLTLEIKGITAEGERVAIEVESSAMGKSGKPYRNRYHFLFVVREGLIVEGREYFDSAHLMDVAGL